MDMDKALDVISKQLKSPFDRWKKTESQAAAEAKKREAQPVPIELIDDPAPASPKGRVAAPGGGFVNDQPRTSGKKRPRTGDREGENSQSGGGGGREKRRRLSAPGESDRPSSAPRAPPPVMNDRRPAPQSVQ